MLIAAMHSGSGPMGPGSPTQPRVRNSILRQMRMLQLALESGAEPGNKNIPSSLDQPSPTHQPGSPMDQKGVWESVAHLAKQAHYDEQIRVSTCIIEIPFSLPYPNHTKSSGSLIPGI